MTEVSIIIPAYNAEKYIASILECVENQTFNDYEAIIVNDGSSDGTKSIIEQYCKKNKKIKAFHQENKGVSSARNKGLELANGNYIVFWDADDYVPKTSLEKLVTSTLAGTADLVIGQLRLSRTHGSRVLTSTKQLSKKRLISKFDKDLLWTYSLSNKMFKRNRINQLNLRFDDKIHNLEDGLFSMSFMHLSVEPIISSCNSVVYEYRKRPFWEESSISQKVTRAQMLNIFESFSKLEEIILDSIESEIPLDFESQGAKNELISDKLLFLSTFYKRFVNGSLITGKYRKLWLCSDNINDLLEEYLEHCKERMFPSMWRQLIKQHFDLKLCQGVLTKEQIAANPIVTIILTDAIIPEDINSIINAFYNQDLLFFELLIPTELYRHVSKEYQEKQNLHQIKTNCKLYQQIKGQYVMFVEDKSWVVGNTLFEMVKVLEKDLKVQCVTVPILKMKDNSILKTHNGSSKTLSNRLYRSSFANHINLININLFTDTAESFILKVED